LWEAFNKKKKISKQKIVLFAFSRLQSKSKTKSKGVFFIFSTNESSIRANSPNSHQDPQQFSQQPNQFVFNN
jgi:hypothetical protein